MSSRSKSFLAKRADLTDQLADIVLAEGLSTLALRDAAAKLATSDRMLLYYFETKAELVLAVLGRISERLSVALDLAATPERAAPAQLLAVAAAAFEGPAVAPFMRVWVEVSALGARGEEPYRQFAARTIAAWLAWLDARLDLPSGEERTRWAAAILALVEGMVLLEQSAPSATAGVGELLAKAIGAARA